MFARKRSYEEIDPAVMPLVNSMNMVEGISTVASCEGHWHGKPPYIYFWAPVHVAALIEKRLREDAMSERPTLVGNWRLEGLFDVDYRLAFCLHAPSYHQAALSMFGAFWYFGVHRRRLNRELLMLTQLVEQAMIPDIREHDEIEVCNCGRHDKKNHGVF